MSKSRLDPQSLAERLDTLMPPGQFDIPPASDDPLVATAARLAAPQQPQPLNPEAKARIRAQMLNAYQQQMADSSAAPRRIPVKGMIVVGILIVITVILIQTVIRDPQETAPPSSTPEPTLTYTVTPLPDTPTPLEAMVITPTVATPTLTTTASATFTLTFTATSTVVTELPATPLPVEATTPAESMLPTTLTIEGPITAINGSIITVFDIHIAVEPNNPALASLQIGDMVRVEGEISGDTTVIVAVNIIVYTDPVIIDQPGAPSVSPGLPAGCRVTGRGRIRCDGSGRGRSSRGS